MQQYIGARYVPLIMGEWNAQQVYEPLSIVEYLNSSYTSKKQVPAGTLPTNSEYWSLTSSSSGALTQLISDVNELDTLTQSMNTTLNNVTRRKILWIGDSYSYAGTYANGVGFAQNLKSILERNGWIMNIMASPGGGFIGSNVQNYQVLLETAPQIPYDEIYIQGFANDYLPEGGLRTGLENAITSFVTKAAQLYPGVPIKALPMTKNITQSHFGDMSQTCSYLQQRGVIINWNAWNWMSNASYFSNDNVHPAQNSNILSLLTTQALMGIGNSGIYPQEGSASSNILLTPINNGNKVRIKQFVALLNMFDTNIVLNGTIRTTTNIMAPLNPLSNNLMFYFIDQNSITKHLIHFTLYYSTASKTWSVLALTEDTGTIPPSQLTGLTQFPFEVQDYQLSLG